MRKMIVLGQLCNNLKKNICKNFLSNSALQQKKVVDNLEQQLIEERNESRKETITLKQAIKTLTEKQSQLEVKLKSATTSSAKDKKKAGDEEEILQSADNIQGPRPKRTTTKN